MLNKIKKAVLGVVVAGSLVLSARAQTDVYAVEFNTGNNGFGIINLMNGDFTEISDRWARQFTTTSPTHRTGHCTAWPTMARPW